MIFALIGDDPEILPLIRALAGSRSHHLECAALVGTLEGPLREAAPGVRILPRWDAILTAGPLDAVLVCGTEESVLEAARQLAAAGNRLLILPRSAQGSTWIYELSLIRDEGNAWIAPIFVDRALPGFRSIHAAIGAGHLGRLRYLRLDREIGPDVDAGGPLRRKAFVEDALLSDADLLRFLGGDYGRISAGFSGAVDDRVAAATVTLSGDELPEATWTLRGTSNPSRYNLVVAGERAEISLSASEGNEDWRATSPARVAIPNLGGDLWSEKGSALLASIERLLTPQTDSAKSHSAQAASDRSDAAAWTDLVRAFEVIDAARLSVRRRRAIDLRAETASERNLFKSQMTALGCLTLILTLVGILFLLLLMPLLDARSRDQIEAERAGSIVRRAEFKPNSAELDPSGVDHLRRLAPKMGEMRFPVLIEPTSAAEDRALNEKRRDAVVEALKKQGVDDAAQRTQVVPTVGEWYPHALRVVRVLVFAPLALFLVLQFFVFLTRPAAR
jgi:hypothetical protein